MVCRHGPDDPSCSSNNPYRYSSDTPNTPDASKYSIQEAERVGNHLVLKVKYPNCAACAYEGQKVMVFLNVKELDVLKWKRIDPHFRDPKLHFFSTDAPSPAARFPASKEGWTDAINYARGK